MWNIRVENRKGEYLWIAIPNLDKLQASLVTDRSKAHDFASLELCGDFVKLDYEYFKRFREIKSFRKVDA